MGGSGSSTTTVDKAFNARLATIYERQQEIADEYYAYWQEYQKGYEIAQTKANQSLLEGETATSAAQTKLAGEQATAASSLLPAQTELAAAQIADQQSTLAQTQGLKSEFFQQATQGLDVNSQVAKAQADVASQYSDTAAATARGMSRMGVNPNSGAYAGVNSSNDIAKAAAVAGARTKARQATEDTNFNRLAMGMQYRSA